MRPRGQIKRSLPQAFPHTIFSIGSIIGSVSKNISCTLISAQAHIEPSATCGIKTKTTGRQEGIAQLKRNSYVVETLRSDKIIGSAA